MMESRDPSHSLDLQMQQAFYEHLRAGYPPPQPSPLPPQQSPLHEHHQQHHHLHHLHYQQQLQHQHQQQHQLQQQHLNSPIIHSPAPLRQINPNPNVNNPNPVPNPNPNPQPIPNPNSASACYRSDSPPHTMPHQLQAASPSPPSGIGASGSAMAPRSAPPTIKKKRGRPRKYGTDGNGTAASVIPLNSSPPAKKKGGKKTPILTLGTTGEGFTPHVLTVGAGEDITAKIMTFSQHGPWAVCILSANGVISNASLWHSGISSSSVTYEGRFEILSLSGLFLLTEDGATRTRTAGFSVSLAGQDGSIIGGRVAGVLIAATPIQVVMGTFFPERRKSHAKSGNLDGSSHMPPTRQPCSPMQRTYTASGPVQGHILGPPASAVKEHHASQVMPLQSEDWGASDFDTDTRSHSE